jgi:protein pelota
MPLLKASQWAAYNLIRENDRLRAAAVRRVQTESSTGSTSSHRVHTTLTIRVKSTTFDIQAGQLHVSGQIVEETAAAHAGQHHTLDLELNRQFSLDKTEGWDSVSIGVVRDACNPGKGASAWAVVMQDGVANIAVLLGERTVLRQRVQVSVPGKKAGEKAHSKGTQSFYQTLLDTLLRHIDIDDDLPILLASPGYTASLFQKFFVDYATRKGDKKLMAQKKNLIVVHSSSGQYHALNEVLKSPEVLSRLADTKYARDTQLMERFSQLMRKDQGRAWYGPREVEAAVDQGGVGQGGGVLLISNQLFRSQDVNVRQRWVNLVDRVRDVEGGEVRILSSEHDSGKKLEALSGIAAILTFPLPDLDEDEDEV